MCLYFQGAQLQRELRADENEIKDLEDQLEREQKEYQEVFTQLQNKVESTEVWIVRERERDRETEREREIVREIKDLEDQLERNRKSTRRSSHSYRTRWRVLRYG